MQNTTIRNISVDELKQMRNSEGLIIQGCRGNPKRWVEAICDILTQEKILLKGDNFKDIAVFEHEGLTNILFNFDNTKLDIGKLAMWRLMSHETLHGTWQSDYLQNKFGISADSPVPQEKQKPEAPRIGADGNIFSVLGIASRTLKHVGLRDEAAAMSERVMSSESYDEALGIIMEYVEPVESEGFGQGYSMEM
jgi:hypothetical protein